MKNILNRIYYNYYNIDKNYYFPIDKDYMRFVFMLRNEKIENLSVNEAIEKYRNRNNPFKDIILNNIDNRRDYLIESETIHITYPIEETLERIKVLYNVIGKKEWEEIFGFNYKLFYNFIVFIIYRIFMFNYVRITHDVEYIKRYEDAFPDSKKCYFTKKELYNFFNNNPQIDKILDFISIDINKQVKKTDSTKLLYYNGKYYLYFIWDFIYNLFDEIEIRILEHTVDVDKFYHKKGKCFESLCYDKLCKYYPKDKIYKNIKYDYMGGNNEVDLILELPKSYLIFECKSSEFNIDKFNSNRELYKRFLTAFGRGFKTIDNLDNYIKSGNNIFYKETKKKLLNLNFKDKKVYFVNLSLYNIEYLQTQIQKIKKEFIKPANVYPICWNYLDFGSIMKLSPLDIKLFEQYLEKRTRLLNKKKSITFDIDEIDAFGFLTEPKYEYVYNMLMNHINDNIDENFMISNGAYRTEFNSMFNKKFIGDYMRKITNSSDI